MRDFKKRIKRLEKKLDIHKRSYIIIQRKNETEEQAKRRFMREKGLKEEDGVFFIISEEILPNGYKWDMLSKDIRFTKLDRRI